MVAVKTVGSLIEGAAYTLSQAGLKNPRLEAECLLAKALQVDRLNLYLSWDRPLTTGAEESFEALLARRKRWEPLQYLLGIKEFWSLTLKVTPDVLIPRPETETLIEVALLCLEKTPRKIRLLDLGTGSGAIALALAKELPAAQIIAADLIPQALVVARENALHNGLDQKVTFLKGDLFQALEGLSLENSFDLIVSNPPYVPSGEIQNLAPEVRDYEPLVALDGGWDGLKYHRLILQEAHRYLRPGGQLLLEIGWDQGSALRDLVKSQAHYGEFKISLDLQGKDRVVGVRKVR
jgi:release factor glutamine methyltransferase